MGVNFLNAAFGHGRTPPCPFRWINFQFHGLNFVRSDTGGTQLWVTIDSEINDAQASYCEWWYLLRFRLIVEKTSASIVSPRYSRQNIFSPPVILHGKSYAIVEIQSWHVILCSNYMRICIHRTNISQTHQLTRNRKLLIPPHPSWSSSPHLHILLNKILHTLRRSSSSMLLPRSS